MIATITRLKREGASTIAPRLCSRSQRSRDSFSGSCSARHVLSSRLAGGDAQCQCSSFFTVSQPARAAQPAAIGRTRPQPAGTRFRTRSFHLTAKGLSACSRGSLEACGKSDKIICNQCLLRTLVSWTDEVVSLCLYVYRCGLCGTAAFRLSYMPD